MLPTATLIDFHSAADSTGLPVFFDPYLSLSLRRKFAEKIADQDRV
jgi:hypothetical protein